MIVNNSQHYFLEGGGEMGERMRLKDWSSSSLGDPNIWPQPLKTMMSVVLSNPFGMCIAWGKDHLQFYNDSFQHILGSERHPLALGLSSKKTFAEVWPIIEPMFDEAINGKSASCSDLMLAVKSDDQIINAYFDFACSPIKLECGTIGGILITINETTESTNIQKDFKDNKNELEFAIEAAQLGTFDYNPQTKKFSCNDRLKNWLKLPSTEQVDLSMAINAVAVEDRQKIKKAIENVLDHNSGGYFDMTFRISETISQKNIFLNAKGKAWYSSSQIAYRFNGTVTDMTSSVLADRKNKESEQQLRDVILKSPIGICLIDSVSFKIEIVNESFAEIVGTAKTEIEGTYYWDHFLEEKNKFKKTLQKVIDSGSTHYDKEVTINLHRNKNKEKVTISFVYGPMTGIDGTVTKVVIWLQDQTKAVAARNKLMVSEKNLRRMILQAPVAIAIFRGRDYTVEIANKFALDLWSRTRREVIHRPIFDSMPELESQGIKDLLDHVYNTGVPYINKELQIQIEKSGNLEHLFVNVTYEPLYNDNDIINGIMAIGFDVTSQVKTRIIAEEREQNVRALVESAPFPIAVYYGEDMQITMANQTIMDIFGKGDDIIGKLYTDIIPELENQDIFDQVREVYRTGRPFHAKNRPFEVEENGVLKKLYFNYSFTPLKDDQGRIYAVMNTGADVTELHETQQKFRESELKFRDAVKQAPLAIAIFKGSNYIAEMANDNYLNLIDKKEDQFIGKPLFDSLPELRDSLQPIISEMYATGDNYYGYEFPVTFKPENLQEPSFYNFVYHPLKEGNVIEGFMVVATEVTANVKAKQLIKENEEKLKLIIEASELGVYDVNLKTDTIVASERCYTLLGFETERNLKYRDFVSNLHPDHFKTRRKAIDEGLKTGKIQYQAQFVHKNGTVNWVDARAKLFYDEHHRPERILGTVRDITEERRFQQALLEREQKFRLLADAVPEFIWTADAEGKVNYFNQALYNFTGLASQDLMDYGWMQIVHPDDRKENLRVWHEAVASGNDYLFEQRFRRHDGEYHWQLTRGIPQKDENGRIKMWVGASTDIQQQKMFAYELERMVEQRTNELQKNNIDLEKINKELESFVYISSHDLQEPLRKIQTFASLIIDSEYDNLSENVRNYFTRMQKSASRMQNLIKDLIAYSRTNSEDINFEIVNLEDIIDDVKETLSEELEQVDVHFELTNICDIKMISVQFQQLLLNLVSNSIKFSKKDEAVSITINCEIKKGSKTGIASLSANQDYCHITYSDNGIGFEPQYSDKIFDVFQRLHSKEDYMGTGIGLAIVKRIIENHDGVIVASSALGKGATFDMYIPNF